MEQLDPSLRRDKRDRKYVRHFNIFIWRRMKLREQLFKKQQKELLQLTKVQQQKKEKSEKIMAEEAKKLPVKMKKQLLDYRKKLKRDKQRINVRFY